MIEFSSIFRYIWENSVEDKKEIYTNRENKLIYKRIIRGVWFHKRTIKLVPI